MSINVTSSGFTQGQPIPARYSCQGQGLSPALSWNGLPGETKSLALIMDDPDAPGGTWVHWVVYNLPPALGGLPEGVSPGGDGPGGSQQGKNSWNNQGYGGPCPPSGIHRYFFKLYALDTTLSLKAGATKQQVLQAMQGHVIGQGEIMGTFRKN